MKEIELLAIIFQLLDKLEYEFPQLRDDILSSISKLYDKDMVDTTNCFINFLWAHYDDVNGYSLINEYIKQEDEL